MGLGGNNGSLQGGNAGPKVADSKFLHRSLTEHIYFTIIFETFKMLFYKLKTKTKKSK
jgi:hypothetical protein